MIKIGTYVIALTKEGSIFAGRLERYEGGRALLTDARRIWYWAGAATISELAARGTSKPSECKIPCPVTVMLIGVTEVIVTTPAGEASIRSVPVWTA